MKNIYKRAIELAATAIASAAIGFGIGYTVGDSHGFERAPVDMNPSEYMSRRHEIFEQRMREGIPQNNADLTDWYMRINQNIAGPDDGGNQNGQ
jgi:hypothetical protein